MKRAWTTLTLGCLLALAVGALPAHAADPKTGPEAPHGTPAQGHDLAKAGSQDGEHHDPALIGGFSEGLVVAITTLIVFAVLMAVLGKYAWGPIATGLKAREDRIRKDIADAEAARARAEATLKEYSARLATAEQQVRDMIAKATAEGETVAAGIRTRAQQEAEETRERALRDIDAARDQAVSQVHEQAAVLATSVAEKILRRNLNADDQRDLVAQSLSELPTIGAGAGHGVGNGRGRA